MSLNVSGTGGSMASHVVAGWAPVCRVPLSIIGPAPAAESAPPVMPVMRRWARVEHREPEPVEKGAPDDDDEEPEQDDEPDDDEESAGEAPPERPAEPVTSPGIDGKRDGPEGPDEGPAGPDDTGEPNDEDEDDGPATAGGYLLPSEPLMDFGGHAYDALPDPAPGCGGWDDMSIEDEVEGVPDGAVMAS